MDLFEKCSRLTAVKETREAGIYPYFHALESRQDVEVMMEGKRRIMLLQHTDQGGPRQLFVIHACPLNSCGGTEKLKILVPLVDASPSLGWRVYL